MYTVVRSKYKMRQGCRVKSSVRVMISLSKAHKNESTKVLFINHLVKWVMNIFLLTPCQQKTANAWLALWWLARCVSIFDS